MKGSHQNLGRNCKIDLHIELQNSSEHISEFIRFQIISRGLQQEQEKEEEQELQEGDKKRKYPKANIMSDGKMTPSGILCVATVIRADYH